MLGAITGDVVGSVYEWNNIKRKDFEPLFSPRAFFTDDSVLTVALMDAIDRGVNYAGVMRWYYSEHPTAGYGHLFHHWCKYETGEIIEFSDTVKDSLKVIAATFECRERSTN